jgi:hypothetical protein
MVILLIPWFPSDATLADNQLAEPSTAFLHIERNAVFLSTEWMTGNGHLDRLYRHDALPIPQSILRPPELASNCRALQPTWLTTATALGLPFAVNGEGIDLSLKFLWGCVVVIQFDPTHSLPALSDPIALDAIPVR